MGLADNASTPADLEPLVKRLLSQKASTRGDQPSHPDLLDYLATELLDSHWDVKAMLKRMVTSATYRQDSRIHPEQWQNDPVPAAVELHLWQPRHRARHADA